MKSFKDTLLSIKGDAFWENLALTYLRDTLNILRLERKLGLIYNEYCPNFIKNIPEYTLNEAVSKHIDYKKFVDFVIHTHKFYKDRINSFNFKLKEILNSLDKNLKKDFLKKISPVIKESENFFNYFINEYKQFEDCKTNNEYKDPQESTIKIYANNIPQLIATLKSLSNNEFLNSNDFKLSELLNDGKIVIINCEGLDETACSILLNGCLETLMRRKIQGIEKFHKISIVIDEAQKAIGKDTDLHTDVLREAEVEVVLSFQNDELMIQKLGNINYDALCQNLVTKFIFRNQKSKYYGNSSSLKQIKERDLIVANECFDLNLKQIIKAKPLFIQEDEQDVAEYEFQKLNKVFENFVADFNAKGKYYLIYDYKNYKHNNIFTIKNIKNKQFRKESFLSQKNLANINNIITNLCGN
ncbi:hypothetical protein [Campylobacter sputorum]|uniref:hypothetical protein n=1 Tax=Campylobacter sputorum TaxID=206 RepID=UPI000B790EE2|nr:hypothetical protein [Campylobacter sputorum]